jgi:2-oxoglutarate dehydrogenase E2 component (dihydrolipoamide succinyltransferase)
LSAKNCRFKIAEPVAVQQHKKVAPISVNGGDEIVEMDRMRKLIAGYMVASANFSTCSIFIEVDV